MELERVGMELDETGHQVVTAEIVAAGRGRADFGDHPVADHDRAQHDLVAEDDAGIGQDGFGHQAILSCGKRAKGWAEWMPKGS